MKQNKRILLWGAGLLLLSMQSCLSDRDDDGNTIFAEAVVTVKPNADNSAFILQLNDSTVLEPTNVKSSPYGQKEMRAHVNFSGEGLDLKAERYPVTLNWIDSILTKLPAADLGEQNEETYGNDPVEIVNNWETSVEDGYLTVRFRTYWGGAAQHTVNVVTGTDPDDPYKIVLYHNANHDTVGEMSYGIAAFSLAGLPDTEGKYVPLTLEWNSFAGVKTTEFKYRTRK